MLFREMMQEVERLRREIDQAMQGGSAYRAQPRFRSAFLPGVSARAYPLMNIRDDGDCYRIEALAPGVDPESLNITATRESLTLAGEKVAPNGVRAEQYHRSERSAGKFTRTFSLPSLIDVNRIRAEYKDGLLVVEAPKAEEAKPKAITIAVNN